MFVTLNGVEFFLILLKLKLSTLQLASELSKTAMVHTKKSCFA